MKRYLKLLLYITLFFSLALGALVVVVYNLKTSHHSNLIKKTVEFKLSSNKYKFEIGDCQIAKFEKDSDKVILSNISITKNQKEDIRQVGKIKNIEVILNTKELFHFKYIPIEINISNLGFEFSKDPNEISEVTENILENIISLIKSQLFWVGNINLHNSKLGFVIGNKTRILNIPKANMALDKLHKKIKLGLTYEVANNDHQLELDLSLVKNRYLNISANLNTLPAHLPISQMNASQLKNLQHEDNKILLTGSIFHSYDARKKAHTSIINFSEITGKLHSIQQPGNSLNIKPSKCYIESVGDSQRLRVNNCSLHFGENSLIELDLIFNKKHSKPTLLEFSTNINNVPVNIINYLSDPDNPNKIKEFVDEFIVAGTIDKGKLNVKLDQSFFMNKTFETSEIKGNFGIKNVGFKYYDAHPSLSELHSEVVLQNGDIKFTNIKGKVEKTNIYDSNVSFNWQHMFKEGIDIECKTKGPVWDYIKYLPQDEITQLKAKGVDLTTMEGAAEADIKVHVPLNPDPVSVQVKTISSNFGMKFLNDTIHLSKTNIQASLEADKLTINGVGLVNDLKSEVNFEHFFNKKLGYQDILKAKINLSANHKPNEFFTVRKGNAVLNIDYKAKEENSFWNIHSNLSPVELYIDKLGIIKPQGKNSHIKFESSTKPDSNEPANFEFIAANDIKITGSLTSKGDITTAHIDNLNYGKTKLKAILDLSSNYRNFKVFGESFDLSNSDLSKLFSSGKRTTASNYDIKINRIFLKNNIDLTGFKFSLKCDKQRCYKGNMNSYLGNSKRFFDMLLNDFKDHEEWILTTNNAGVIFKGFGIYENIRGGTMILRLNNQTIVNKNDKIKQPLIYGDINLRRFTTIKTPFITRLVSFISLPGFMGTIMRKNDIVFTEFNSKFAVNDGIVSIMEGAAEGAFFDFTIRGRVDTNKKFYEFKGAVIPSLYGISWLVKKLPIIGKIFSGGHRKGLIFAPYVLRDHY